MTLIQSSPTTLSWLAQVKSRVFSQRPQWGYHDSLYYAVFEKPSGGNSIAQLNVNKKGIRVFLRLYPSVDPDLKSTPASYSYAKWMPSVYFLRSSADVPKTSDMIIRSGDSYTP